MTLKSDASRADDNIMRAFTTRQRWVFIIATLVSVGAAVQIVVTGFMLQTGARAGGDLWLHNDSDASIESLNALFEEQLMRSVANDVGRADVVAAAGAGDWTRVAAIVSEENRDDDPEDRFVVTAANTVVASDVPCAANFAAHLQVTGFVVCSARLYLAARQPLTGGAELFVLRLAGERYIDALQAITLCEVEIAFPGGTLSSLKAIDGRRLYAPFAHADVESSALVDVDLGAPYAGIPGRTIAVENWPARGERSFAMLMNTRPLADVDGASIATMVPMSILEGSLGAALLALIGLGLVMIAVLALAAYRIVRHFTAPLLALDDTAKQIAQGDLSRRAPVSGDPEVASLARSFNAMTAALLETRTQLLQQEKLVSIGQLASGVAHELNTPLQFVGDSVAFVAGKLDDVAAASDPAALRREMKEALADAQTGIDRLLTVVGAMKQFSQPGKKSTEPVSLRAIAENTATIARNEWHFVADLEIQMSPQLPLVRARKDEIGQVLLNLVVNAAHAIGEKNAGSAKRGKIVVEGHVDGNDAVLSVADDGAGMTEAVKTRLFEPFFTTKPVGKGSGQGLAISWSIVRKHGGTIAVDSAPGVGTTFTLRLPLALGAQRP